MTKKKKPPTHSRNKAKDDDLPLVVAVFIITGSLVGYLMAEMVLAAQPHPFHWAVLALGGILGWFLGRVYFQFKVDIV